MNKTILKSVRLSPDIYRLIMSYEGGNFSAKLENMVRSSMPAMIGEMQDKLAYLDRAVRRRKEQCDCYWKFQDELEEIGKLVQIQADAVRKMRGSMDWFNETVRRDIDQTAGYLSALNDKEKEKNRKTGSV